MKKMSLMETSVTAAKKKAPTVITEEQRQQALHSSVEQLPKR